MVELGAINTFSASANCISSAFVLPSRNLRSCSTNAVTVAAGSVLASSFCRQLLTVWFCVSGSCQPSASIQLSVFSNDCSPSA